MRSIMGTERFAVVVLTCCLPVSAAVWGQEARQAEGDTEVRVTYRELHAPAKWTFRATSEPRGDQRQAARRLAAGDYDLTLISCEPTDAGPGENIFDMAIAVHTGQEDHVVALDRIDVAEVTAGQSQILVRTYPVCLAQPGVVQLTLTPRLGVARIAGAMLLPVNRPDVFSADVIEELASRVNASQLARPWTADDRNWIRATYYTGVMAMYRATGDPQWLDQAKRWAEKHQWQVGTERSGANVLTCVQTYLQLGEAGVSSNAVDHAITWLDSGAPNTPSGAEVWYFEAGRRYVDSLYVGPPALAMLAQATGEAKYLDFMDAMFWDVHRELFDEASGLFYRDGRFRSQSGDVAPSELDLFGKRKTWVHTITPGGKKVIWSRGNGWAFAGITRILTYLPEDHPSRDRYLALFRTMAAALASRQQPDGSWRMNLDDPDQYPIPEASGTGFFVAGLAWGINHQVLDRREYLPVARRGWQRLTEMVSAGGKVQWGQPVSGSPYDIRYEDSHEYVTGTFLLAASEILRLIEASETAEGDSQ